MEALKDLILPSTEGLGSNGPTELFCRKGAVDQRLDEGRRARIASAAGGQSVSSRFAGYGLIPVISPAEGRSL